MRLCERCGETKALHDFHKDRRGCCKVCRKADSAAYYARTRDLQRAKARAWRQANPEKQRAAAKAWRAKNKDAIKDQKRQEKYGVLPGTFSAKLAAQEGKCAICGVDQSTQARGLCLDHCHTNGTIGALLCTPCNTGLGSFKDSPELLRNASQYLALFR